MSDRGGRPSVFDPSLGEAIVRMLAADVPRKTIAAKAGIALRTFQDWLRRGREGDPAYIAFAAAFDRQAKANRQTRIARAWRRYDARAKERWRAFKAARASWWFDRLGPREFWSRRLSWAITEGRTRAVERALAELEALSRDG
jgi:hypothetical protein